MCMNWQVNRYRNKLFRKTITISLMNNNYVTWYLRLEVINNSFQLGHRCKSPMNKSWNREVINLELKQILISVVTFIKRCYFLYSEGLSSVKNLKSNAHCLWLPVQEVFLVGRKHYMFLCANWTDTVFIVHGSKQIFSPVPNPKLYL